MSTMRAKLSQNGGSQAVRLPREFRFPEDQSEVVVHREGDRVILEPLDTWPQSFLATLGAWPEEIERPERQLPSSVCLSAVTL